MATSSKPSAFSLAISLRLLVSNSVSNTHLYAYFVAKVNLQAGVALLDPHTELNEAENLQ